MASDDQDTVAAGEHGAKRRKIRKGTQSCWECKRRKARCTFILSSDAVCTGCQKRGTACISQDVPEEMASRADGQANDRLGRVEVLVEKLVKTVDSWESMRLYTGHPSRSAARNTPNEEPFLEHYGRRTSPAAIASPICENRPQGRESFHLFSYPPSFCPPPDSVSPGAIGDGRASRILLAAWPSQHDLDIISKVSSTRPEMQYGITYVAQSMLSSHDSSLVQDILQQPSPRSHPVHIARSLLLLGTFLECVPSNTIHHLDSLTCSYRDIKSRAVHTATHWATSNDEYTDSVEGIEYLFMESMYHNNIGNLRRSWLSVRRAIDKARLMGLDQATTGLVTVDPTTTKRADPEKLWFLLIRHDRYLSLILGLPQSSSTDVFATPERLKRCDPQERMQRIHCTVGSRITLRSKERIFDVDETRHIDELLQAASDSMPSRWWSMPDLCPHDTDNLAIMHEMTRLTSQLTHYHLLVSLHLPYLLHPAADESDYSIITAINASREILTRTVSFLKSEIVHFYCRGTHTIAFIASTALCLAHIEGGLQRQSRSGERTNILALLTHQRHTDRGMIEQIVEIMGLMSSSCERLIPSVVSPLRRLLAIEHDVAGGGMHQIHFFPEDRGGGAALSKPMESISNEYKTYQISIPHLGRIKIRHDTSAHGALNFMGENTQQAARLQPTIHRSDDLLNTNRDINLQVEEGEKSVSLFRQQSHTQGYQSPTTQPLHRLSTSPRDQRQSTPDALGNITNAENQLGLEPLDSSLMIMGDGWEFYDDMVLPGS